MKISVNAINAEMAFDKIQYYFIVKTLNKLGVEGNFSNIIKVTYEKAIANIIINDECLKALVLKSGVKQRHSLSPLLFNIVLKVLVIMSRQEKEIRHIN
jgi:hypothetical protein